MLGVSNDDTGQPSRDSRFMCSAGADQGSACWHQAAQHAHCSWSELLVINVCLLRPQVMKKKPKKGARPGTKPLTKLEPVPSFFSFFSPPEVPAEGTELSEDAIEELQATMEEDYEMGCVPCWQSPTSLCQSMQLESCGSLWRKTTRWGEYRSDTPRSEVLVLLPASTSAGLRCAVTPCNRVIVHMQTRCGWAAPLCTDLNLA